MKKIISLLSLLFISFFGFSQTKGISYQAVIIDPNPIQIPGKDIAAQPYVSKGVWIRFGIFAGTTLQYEELHKTLTDEYGLINLVIGGGVNTGKAGTFNSLNWDGLTKNIVTSVSFDLGIRYTDVSNQKLTYVPYSLLAETAVNLAGVLPIASGGTGATNAIAARANLGLSNVDNTADVDKPVSIATLAILDVKESLANKSTNILADSASTVKYPSVKAIKEYIDSRTNAQAPLTAGRDYQTPLVAGTDYVRPNGSAANLTNFPTLNQSTTGNASTATLAGNITATTNTSLTSLTNLTTVGTITSGVWSGTTISIEKGGTGVSTSTGSGNVVLSNSPTLVTPTLGVASATSLNKVILTAPTTVATLTIADGKTFTANNSVTLAGTDATTMTFPTTNATIARTDAAQTFAGTQTLSSNTNSTSTSNGALVVTGGVGIGGNVNVGGALSGANSASSTISGFAANINNQTGTTYTLTASDNGKIITLNNSSAITLTIPSGLQVGFNCMIVQLGTGQVTLSASSVTVTNRSGFTKTSGQNAIATIISVVSNTFITGGDMTN